MFKSYKYRVYPNDIQKEQLTRFFGVVRLIYNLGLEAKTMAYSVGKKTIYKNDLIKQIPALKKENKWISECPSQSLQHALINLDTAYQNFFKKRAKFPRFKNKYKKQTVVFPQGFSINFDKGTIKLPKLKKLSVIYDRQFEGIPKRVTLSKTPTNKYFVSILVDTGVEAPQKPIIKKETTVGIDLGIKNFAITSDGKVYENKKLFKKQQKRLRIEQRSLGRKKKGSKNREKQKLKVAILHEKVRNQRTDYLHKLSTTLVKSYGTIILEDLSVKDMLKNKNLSKAISDAGWRQFRTFLEYKAEWHGKNIIIIGRFEPSSKICSKCGSIKRDLKLSDRQYKCEKCKFEIDRDLNAAINIKSFGLRTQPLCVNVRH